MLGWIPGRSKSRGDHESETAVVAMIAEEDTPLRTLRSQVSKTRLDQLLADSAPLKRRLDRDRAKGKPTLQRRRPHPGERDVANDSVADQGDERNGKRLGLAQFIDDSRLAPVAERQSGEGTRGERPDGVVVGGRLWSDQNGQRTLAHQTGLRPAITKTSAGATNPVGVSKLASIWATSAQAAAWAASGSSLITAR